MTYGHGAQWLIYALLQEGRYAESARWVDSMRAQTARFAEGGKVKGEAEQESRVVPGARPRCVCRRHPRVAIAARDARDRHQRARRARPGGERSRARAGGARARRASAGRLDSREADARDSARAPAAGDESASERGYAEVIEQVLRAAVLHAGGEHEKAVAVLRTAAAQDDSLPFAFGPPVEIVSPHEMAGEYLLESNRAGEAAQRIQAALARRRANGRVARARERRSWRWGIELTRGAPTRRRRRISRARTVRRAPAVLALKPPMKQ